MKEQTEKIFRAIGDVVILGNSEDHLFYFVCRSAVGFIG